MPSSDLVFRNADDHREILEMMKLARLAGMQKLRMFGGFAYWYHCPRTRDLFAMPRASDYDLVIPRLNSLLFEALASKYQFQSIGTCIYSGGVLRNYKSSRWADTTMDLYSGRLTFNHMIDYAKVIQTDWPTLPLAELLVTKLQMHHLHQRDENDIMMLLCEHELGCEDEDQINPTRVADMCCGDWGLYHEAERNLRLVRTQLAVRNELPLDMRVRAGENISMLVETLQAHSKTKYWHLRSLYGERLKWWNNAESTARKVETDADTR